MKTEAKCNLTFIHFVLSGKGLLHGNLTVYKSNCSHVSVPMKLSAALCRLTFLLVEPADAAAVVMRLEEQLSEELPQVDGLAGVVTHHI